jgi:hypothetical protein
VISLETRVQFPAGEMNTELVGVPVFLESKWGYHCGCVFFSFWFVCLLWNISSSSSPCKPVECDRGDISACDDLSHLSDETCIL